MVAVYQKAEEWRTAERRRLAEAHARELALQKPRAPPKKPPKKPPPKRNTPT
jgi:hypothetical protein